VAVLPSWAVAGRAKWTNSGPVRPDFAIVPNSRQESVWDYPRPPRVVSDDRLVSIRVGEVLVAHATNCLRVLETASPPTFYLPSGSIRAGSLESSDTTSQCEWKGVAAYLDLILDGTRFERVAWYYPEPFSEYEELRDYVAFYPGRVDCYVGDERVLPQLGGFYAGWVTAELVGPWKGEPGSEGW